MTREQLAERIEEIESILSDRASLRYRFSQEEIEEIENNAQELKDQLYDIDNCRHEPAPRIVPPIGHPLPTCKHCGIVYLLEEDDE
jgi:hypothetical protein